MQLRETIDSEWYNTCLELDSIIHGKVFEVNEVYQVKVAGSNRFTNSIGSNEIAFAYCVFFLSVKLGHQLENCSSLHVVQQHDNIDRYPIAISYQ